MYPCHVFSKEKKVKKKEGNKENHTFYGLTKEQLSTDREKISDPLRSCCLFLER